MKFIQKNNFLLFIIAVMLVFTVGIGASFIGDDDQEKKQHSFVVQPRSLDFYVRERGFVRPAKVAHIKSQIESNRAQLIWMLPEGEEVKAGDLVARFDANPLLEKLEKAEQEYADSIANLESAKKLFDIEKEQKQGKLEEAKRKLEMAKIKADDIRNGSGVLERSKVEQNKVKAQRTVEFNERELEDFDLLLSKGHVSKRERDKVAENLRISKESLKLAIAESENFNKYKWPKMLNEATMTLNSATAEFDRIKKTSEIEMQQNKDRITIGTRYLQKAEKRVHDLENSIENCEVKAPIGGKLLYIKLHRADGMRKSRVGDVIWNAQSFMAIPDTSKMVVDVEIREVDVAKVAKGNIANITLDAIPNKTFSGTVVGIETIAKENEKNEHLRKFNLVIELDNISEKMHVGMSADVRIHYQHLEGVLAVPTESVFYHKGKPALNIIDNDAEILQEVEVGNTSDKWVHVISGIQSGQIITYD